MKRTFCLILAALMLSSSLVACAESNVEETSSNETTPNAPSADESTVESLEETEEVITDSLPEVKYDGEEFMIYNTEDPGNVWATTTYVDFAEDSAETIPSAIFNRNLTVEERFDVIISETYQAAGDLNTLILAGGDGVDLTLLEGSTTIGWINSGLLYNLDDLPNLELDKPYWDQNSRKYLTLAGKYFEGVGDFMTTHIDETTVMYFNKKLITDYQLENPYELVDNYKWVYDKVYEMGVKVLSDLNGDGVRNDQDRWGHMSVGLVAYPQFIYGSGETYITKDENDYPVVSFYNERFIAVYEKILEIFHSEGDTFFYDANIMKNTMGLGSDHRVQEIMFPNNQSLFWSEVISWARSLRNMDADFGIIPPPMYEESQQAYHCFTNGGFYGQCVPITITGDALEFTTIIMEALNSHSGKLVDAYYDISLKGKDSRDEESGRMLDIIFANRIYDVSIVFDVASINNSLIDKAAANDADLASYYNKNKKVMRKTIDKMMANVTKD